jgi:ketosteroid isomerase-like protein
MPDADPAAPVDTGGVASTPARQDELERDTTIVVCAYDAFARRDLGRLGQLVVDDVQVFVGDTGPGPLASTIGRDRLLDRLARLVNGTDGTAAARLVGLYATTGGRVLALHEESSRRRGREHRARAGLLVTVGALGIRRIDRLERVDLVAAARRVPVDLPWAPGFP